MSLRTGADGVRVIKDDPGLGGSKLAALAIVFVWKFLPETRELPVEEIVRVFDKQQEGAALHKVA